jgi:type IV pilus assembly protein PilB
MVNTVRQTKRRLGEILMDEGLLSETQVQEALKRQRETGELLGESLVKLGHVTETDIARTIATQFGYPFLNAAKYFIPAGVLPLVPVDMALDHQMIPLDKMWKILILATAGVVPPEVLEGIEKQNGVKIFLYVSTSSQILEAINKNYKAPPKKR